ncbi:hypothetical protein PYCC9005_005997 [Savitreella phatthalungensis]
MSSALLSIAPPASLPRAGSSTTAAVWALDLVDTVNRTLDLDLLYFTDSETSEECIPDCATHSREVQERPRPVRHVLPTLQRADHINEQLAQYEFPSDNALRLPDIVRRIFAAPSCISPNTSDDDLLLSSHRNHSDLLIAHFAKHEHQLTHAPEQYIVPVRRDEVKCRRPLVESVESGILNDSFAASLGAPSATTSSKSSHSQRSRSSLLVGIHQHVRVPPPWVSMDTEYNLPRSVPRRHEFARDLWGHEHRNDSDKGDENDDPLDDAKLSAFLRSTSPGTGDSASVYSTTPAASRYVTPSTSNESLPTSATMPPVHTPLQMSINSAERSALDHFDALIRVATPIAAAVDDANVQDFLAGGTPLAHVRRKRRARMTLRMRRKELIENQADPDSSNSTTPDFSPRRHGCELVRPDNPLSLLL